eukprot:m.53371 g.53371  ORF g.53371 m.53371 type:complete len:273 (-) comp15442_c0_seq9:694-1512(-)
MSSTIAEGSPAQAFVSLISLLPHGRWYCISSRQYDNDAVQFSMAGSLGVSDDVIQTGLKACNYFRTHGGVGSLCCLPGLNDTMTKFYLDTYGTTKKGSKCKWLWNGDDIPENVHPKDQLHTTWLPCVSAEQASYVAQFSGIVMRKDTTAVHVRSAETPDTSDTTNSKSSSRKRKARKPLFDCADNGHKKTRTLELISSLCDSANVDKDNLQDVRKLLSFLAEEVEKKNPGFFKDDKGTNPRCTVRHEEFQPKHDQSKSFVVPPDLIAIIHSR